MLLGSSDAAVYFNRKLLKRERRVAETAKAQRVVNN